MQTFYGNTCVAFMAGSFYGNTCVAIVVRSVQWLWNSAIQHQCDVTEASEDLFAPSLALRPC
jgi:hypothetical protein